MTRLAHAAQIHLRFSDLTREFKANGAGIRTGDLAGKGFHLL
jgi:hypothetical protein